MGGGGAEAKKARLIPDFRADLVLLAPVIPYEKRCEAKIIRHTKI